MPSIPFSAGRNIAEYCDAKGTEAEAKHDLGIDTKSNSADICTKIDVLNEELVTKAIQQTFPDHEIIGEESTGTGAIPPLTEKKTWIIDPVSNAFDPTRLGNMLQSLHRILDMTIKASHSRLL